MQKFQDEINILAGPRLALPVAAARRVEERARQNQTTGGVGQYRFASWSSTPHRLQASETE